MPRDANNLALWQEVSAPDPSYTKPFVRGDFSGTAINPTYIAKLATEQFGPIGIGWGFEVVDERIIEGAPLMWGKSGECLAYEKVHRVQLKLWFKQPRSGTNEKGEITQYGSTKFVYMGSDGRVTSNDEAFKSSVTDAMTKCLSLLGFAADVYMNNMDGSKYSQGDKAKGVNFGEQTPNGEGPQAQDLLGTSSQARLPGQSERYRNYKGQLDAGIPKNPDEIIHQINMDTELSTVEKATLKSHQSLSAKPSQSRSQFL